MNRLLSVEHLRTEFPGQLRAVDDVSFTVERGETVGVVGESGSGKSLTALSLMRLVPPPGRTTAGRVLLEGEDLLSADEDEMRAVRGARMAMVFQDPLSSFNPVLTVERQMTEGMQEHLGIDRGEARRRAVELLERVGLPGAARRVGDYPHQFSGGMRQRVMIAMALSAGPELVLADEPTTALDVTIQAQILDLLRVLRAERGLSIVLISHDLGVVAALAQRVLVMYAGRIVESGTAHDIFHGSRMPYTWALLNSLPRLDAEPKAELQSIPGQPPSLADLPPGCAFHPRCPLARDVCRIETPALTPRPQTPGLEAACHATEPGGWAA